MNIRRWPIKIRKSGHFLEKAAQKLLRLWPVALNQYGPTLTEGFASKISYRWRTGLSPAFFCH
jgi:hypothetical protein